MRQRAAVRVEMAALPGGEVRAVFRGPGAADLSALAVKLDGVLHQIVSPEPGKRGATQARFTLPRQLVFGTLDLLSLPGCDSLLPLPWRLDTAYGLRLAALQLDGLAVRGGFAAAPWLADRIGVELLDGPALAGQGIAVRDEGAETWRFDVPLANLAAPGRTVHLAVRIGGHIPNAKPVVIAPNALGVLGCLDVVTPTRVEGWALRTGSAGPAVMLDVLIGNDVVGTVRADRKRSDISLSDGAAGGALCGFAFELPKPADPRAAKRISVRVSGTRTGLTGSPVIIDPMPSLMGRFDTLAVIYDVARRDGSALAVALRYGADGAAEPFEAPPVRALTRSFWGLPRVTRSEGAARIVQTLEDAPFYGRSVVESRLCGHGVTAMHENLDLDRFDTWWMRLMLPFKAPRWVL
jgi:hypothetical protein